MNGDLVTLTIEVIGPLGVILLARNVENCQNNGVSGHPETKGGMRLRTKVGRESENLLANKHIESVNGSIAKDLVPVNFVVRLFGNIQVFTGLGDVDLITLHRSVVGMVTMMGNPPREVRGPQEGMGNLEAKSASGKGKS